MSAPPPSVLSNASTAAASVATSPFSRPLRLGLARRLMRFGAMYNTQIRPFLQSLPKFACESWCLLGNKTFASVVAGPNREFPSLKDVLRDERGTPEMALEALRTIELWKHRLEQSNHKSFLGVHYELQVGDVVRHVQLGHVGVVAAQLPLCFESDAWVNDNLGSVTDPRMQHPWYLVLVARHDGLPMDFVRYGSQLTHHKMSPGRSIGFHRLLPMFFKGFDPSVGRYLPKEDLLPPLPPTPQSSATTGIPTSAEAASGQEGEVENPTAATNDIKEDTNKPGMLTFLKGRPSHFTAAPNTVVHKAPPGFEAATAPSSISLVVEEEFEEDGEEDGEEDSSVVGVKQHQQQTKKKKQTAAKKKAKAAEKKQKRSPSKPRAATNKKTATATEQPTGKKKGKKTSGRTSSSASTTKSTTSKTKRK